MTELNQTGEEAEKKKNPMEILGFAVAIVAFLTMILIFLYQDKQASKNLLIYPITRSLLVPDSEKGNFQISVNGIDAKNVYLNEIIVSNVGGQPINDSDFYRGTPLKISFGEGCKLISQSISKYQPDSLTNRASVFAKNESIYLKPLLLNSGDSITLKAITSNCTPQLYADVTIVGISEVAPKDPYNKKAIGLILLSVGLLSIGFSALFILPTYLIRIQNFTQFSSFVIPILVFITMAGFAYIFGIKDSVSTNSIPSICTKYSGGGE